MELISIEPDPSTYLQPKWKCIAESADDVLDDCKIVTLFREDVAHLIEQGWLMFNEAYIHGDHMIEERKELTYHIPLAIYRQDTRKGYRWRIDRNSVNEFNPDEQGTLSFPPVYAERQDARAIFARGPRRVETS